MNLFNCPYCTEKTNLELDSLRIHVSKKHKTSSKQLHLDLFRNGEKAVCACGCGEEPKFQTLQLGYAIFRPGHQARVNNNWGHNEKALKKSQATRREMFKNGEIIPWCKGLTKETSETIANYSRIQSENFTPEKREIYSKRLIQQKLDGITPPPKGPKHGRWKGGTSALQNHVRSHLHYAWTYPIMIRDSFDCQKCSNPEGTLQVHHTEETFASILHKAIKFHGDYIHEQEGSKEVKDKITQFVIEYHVQNKIPGISLCTECHKLEHSKE